MSAMPKRNMNNFVAAALRRVCAIAVAAVLVASPELARPAAADPPPVRLKVAYGENYAVSGMTFSWTTIRVKVRNIDYQKQVTMHYRAPGATTWQDHPLAFMGHYGNYDLFGGDGSTPVAEELVIRYAVPDQEFWDNNNGANYSIGTFHGAVGGNVMLNEARAVVYVESGGGFAIPVSRFQGQIYVQNLSHHKIVGVRWSRDGGATWQTTNATYGGKVMAVASQVPEVEIWNFQTPTLTIVDSTVPYRFAVYYEQRNGDGTATVATHWDNNFTQDYFLAKINDTTIR
jgi:hypothetical protein